MESNTTLQTSTGSGQTSVTEQKYANLRKRLDQLGYRQTMGVESLPLIEKLFNDLVHTTESLKNAKLEVNITIFPLVKWGFIFVFWYELWLYSEISKDIGLWRHSS